MSKYPNSGSVSTSEMFKDFCPAESSRPRPIEPDVINHPRHYTREGAMESIDEMILIFGKEAVKWFCVCNAWKYRYRAGDKNGSEDIKKSDWYIAKYKELGGGELREMYTPSNWR